MTGPGLQRGLAPVLVLPGDQVAAKAAIEQLLPSWQGRIQSLCWLPGGYSNSNWLLDISGQPPLRAVVRLVGPGPQLINVDRQREVSWLRAAAGLAPDVLHVDLPAGHLVTRWLDGRLLADQPVADLSRPLALVRRLHQLVGPPGAARYDPLQLAAHYLAAAAVTLPATLWPAPVPWSRIRLLPCHNDLNPWNLMLCSQGSDRLLDWEWAAPGWPLFDVAGLVAGYAREPGYFADDLLADAAQQLGLAHSPGDRRHCRHLLHLREYAWAELQMAWGNHRAEVVLQRDQQLLALTELVQG